MATVKQNAINKTLIAGTKVTLGSDATNDIYYLNGSGEMARLGIGTSLQQLRVNAGVTALEWGDQDGGITTLNTLTATTQTFATGTTGTDFGISSAGSTHTFNIPDASASNRGLVTVGAQTIAGAKTFSGNAVFSGDLTVNGTTTYLNSTNTDITDKNITINKGGDDASSEGAGLQVERTATDGSFIYADASATKFKIGALGSEVDVVGISSTQTVTNKTLGTGSAIDLGSDAEGDVYYRNSGGDLARLGIGTNGQALTTNSGATAPEWTDVSGGFTIDVETTTASAIADKTIHISNNASRVTFTLPATCAVGFQFKVGGLGAGGWKIAQNASQLMHYGDTVTVTGITGQIDSSNQFDSVEVVCVVADTTFLVLNGVGNPDITIS